MISFYDDDYYFKAAEPVFDKMLERLHSSSSNVASSQIRSRLDDDVSQEAAKYVIERTKGFDENP